MPLLLTKYINDETDLYILYCILAPCSGRPSARLRRQGRIDGTQPHGGIVSGNARHALQPDALVAHGRANEGRHQSAGTHRRCRLRHDQRGQRALRLQKRDQRQHLRHDAAANRQSEFHAHRTGKDTQTFAGDQTHRHRHANHKDRHAQAGRGGRCCRKRPDGLQNPCLACRGFALRHGYPKEHRIYRSEPRGHRDRDALCGRRHGR